MSGTWASDLGRALTRDTPAFNGQLAAVDDTIRGTVENGPHVLIEDPELRTLVAAHVGDALAWVALSAGLDEARKAARTLRGDGPVPTALRSNETKGTQR